MMSGNKIDNSEQMVPGVLYVDFVAGSVGGALGVLISHPLDTIKTWQQASNSRLTSAVSDIFKRNRGFNGFYRGMLFPLVSTGVVNSILFGVYGNHLRQLQKICHSDFQKEQLEYQHTFFAGSLAGFVSCFVACPIELIKIRLQTQSYYNNYLIGQRKTPVKLFKKILKHDGIRGLYRGLLPMFFRDVLPYGLYMVIYQKTVKFFDNSTFVRRKREENRILLKYDIKTDTHIDFLITTFAGAWAGILSWVCVIPFDVVKTLMQSESNIVYRGIYDCFKTNLRLYGWKSLFRGSWILVARAVPFNAATFLGYENCFKYMSGGTEHHNMMSINNKF